MSSQSTDFPSGLTDATAYVGASGSDVLCGTFPSVIVASTYYPVTCNLVGDYVKIVTGRNLSDQQLQFAEVYIFTSWRPYVAPTPYDPNHIDL